MKQVPSPRILVAIPNSRHQHQIIAILEQNNYKNFAIAINGKSATQLLCQEDFDILIAFASIEKLDIWRLTRLIRSGIYTTKYNIPIIILSELESRFSNIALSEHEINFLLLPFEYPKIPEVLHSYFESKVSLITHPTMLIIDDIIDILNLANRMLSGHFDIDIAINGKTGIDAWMKKQHDLILLDIKLPDMNGSQVLKHILNINSHQPIIVMTAYGTAEEASELMLCGASDFIEKPFKGRSLKRICELALRRECYIAKRLFNPTSEPNTLQKLSSKNMSFEVLTATENWIDIEALLNSSADMMINNNKLSLLSKWIETIPSPYRQQSAHFKYWEGMVALHLHKPDYAEISRKAFSRAFELYKQKNDINGQLSAWSAIVESIFEDWQQFYLLDNCLAMYDQLIGTHQLNLSPDLEAKVTAHLFFALNIRKPDNPILIQYEERMFQLLKSGLEHATVLTVYNYLLTIYFLNHASKCHLHESFKVNVGHLKLPDHYLLKKHNIDIIKHYLSKDYVSALKILNQSIQFNQSTFAPHYQLWNRILHITCFSRSRLTLETNEWIKKYLAEFNNDASVEQAIFYHALSQHMITQNQFYQAMDYETHALNHIKNHQIPIIEIHYQISYAYTLHLNGNTDEAWPYLEQLGSLQEQIHQNQYLQYLYWLTKALCDFKLGYETNAKIALTNGIKIARQQDWLDIHDWHPDAIIFLYIKSLALNIETEYFRKIMLHNHLQDIPNPEEWPWPIKIYIMDGFEVYLNDELMLFRNNSAIRQDLLVQLIIHGNKRIEKDLLIENIWDGQIERNTLNVYLHRLRKTFGDQIFKLSNNYVELNHSVCWVDVWNIEAVIKKITEILDHPEINQAQLLTLSQYLLRLYKPTILDNTNEKLDIITFETDLQNKVIDLLENLCHFWINVRQFDYAEQYANKGLDIDRYHEPFYLLLMMCYQHLGNNIKAKKIYQNCETMLKDELNIQPSEHIQRFYSNLNDSD